MKCHIHFVAVRGALSLALSMLVLAVSPGLGQTQERPQPFAELGAALADIPGLKPARVVGSSDELTYYTKQGDRTEWKGVKLYGTTYAFGDDGTLERIEMWTARTPVSYEYNCTDVQPSIEPWVAFMEKIYTDHFFQNTDLDFDVEPADRTAEELDELGAVVANIDVYVIEPSKLGLSGRQLFAELTTFEWIDERDPDKPEEFTASEIRRARAGERIPLEVHQCAHRLRFRQDDPYDEP